MPLYTYTCECGKTFEEYLKNNREEVVCSCGSKKLFRHLGTLVPIVPSISFTPEDAKKRMKTTVKHY